MAIDYTSIRNPELKRFFKKYFPDSGSALYMGAPALADVDLIVTTTNMKAAAYTVAAQPDVPRNITVTSTQVGGVDDTLGTVVVVGTGIDGRTITETLTPVNGSAVAGAKAFKTVTSVTGVGWVINTGNDTITVGIGTVLGLSRIIDVNTNVITILGVAPIAPTIVYSATNVENNTIDASSGTYNGTKKLFAWIFD